MRQRRCCAPHGRAEGESHLHPEGSRGSLRASSHGRLRSCITDDAVRPQVGVGAKLRSSCRNTDHTIDHSIAAKSRVYEGTKFKGALRSPPGSMTASLRGQLTLTNEATLMSRDKKWLLVWFPKLHHTAECSGAAGRGRREGDERLSRQVGKKRADRANLQE